MIGNSGSKSHVVFEGREWVVLLRGLVAITFAVAALTWPSMTQPKLVQLFGIYALTHGALSVIGAIAGRRQPGCWLLGTEGAVGIWAGLTAVRGPLPAPLTPILIIWLWAAATGIIQVVEAIRLRRQISGDVWLALGGAVTLCFGSIIWIRPFIGLIGLAVAIGVFAVLWGIFELLLGKELRSMRHGRLAGGT
ncbi:MAG TPA: HdeD family acid-resistance protein [Bryobacteraceae bacterium]|nr:HdeD family acid-resistance protein [Bryobacteraceae bacterium]